MRKAIVTILLPISYFLFPATAAAVAPDPPSCTDVDRGISSFACPGTPTGNICGAAPNYTCYAGASEPSCTGGKTFNCNSCACACPGGTTDCSGTCVANLSCPAGMTANTCAGTCTTVNVLLAPGATAQTGSPNVDGNITSQTGFCIGAACITAWPSGGGGGTLTGSGTANYISKWGSASALGDSGLYQTAAGLYGIGTAAPAYKFDITDTGITPIIRMTNSGATPRQTGIIVNRAGGATPYSWFLGMNAANNDLVVGNIIQAGTSVGIGASPVSQYALDIRGFWARLKDNFDVNTHFVIDSGITAARTSQLDFLDRGTQMWTLTKTAANDLEFVNGFNTPLRLPSNTGNAVMPTAGAKLSVGTPLIGFSLDVQGEATVGGTSIMRIGDNGGALHWMGTRLDRVGVGERWFIGMNDVNNSLRIRRNATTDDLTIDNTTGKVTVGSLQVTGGAAVGRVLTSDGSGNATWQAGGSSCPANVVLTAATTNGNAGGYIGATSMNSRCATQLAGSHICTPDEIIAAYQCGTPGMPASGNGWIANGGPGYTSPASNDCGGWLSAAGTSYGDFWQFNATGGLSYATACNQTVAVACCK